MRPKPGAAVAHGRREGHRLRELAAQHTEIAQDRTLAGSERDQLDQVDRDDITGFGAALDDWSGNWRQGMPVTSRGEWCRHRADILDVVEGAAYLDRELLAGVDGHRRRSVGIDREEVFGPVRPHGATPPNA
jgi:hypothetical protein